MILPGLMCKHIFLVSGVELTCRPTRWWQSRRPILAATSRLDSKSPLSYSVHMLHPATPPSFGHANEKSCQHEEQFLCVPFLLSSPAANLRKK